MMNIKYTLIFLMLGILSFSCVQDDMDDEDSDPGQLIILNEGAFSANNASISTYNPVSQDVNNDVFSSENNFPLGDVGQSMEIIDDSLLWVVVNNSGKIEIANANTFNSINTIEGFTSPRYILPFDNQTAYVSDLFAARLNIIDINTMEKSGTIELTNPVEEIVKHHSNHIIAAGWTANNQLYKIDVNTKEIIDSLEVTYEPNSLEYDSEGNLWVMCSGGYQGSQFREDPMLLKVDPAEFTITDSFEFSSPDHYPSEMVYNESENALYYLLGTNADDMNLGIYKFSVTDTEIPSQAYIPTPSDHSFYTLNAEEDGSTWITDAGDFSTPGTVIKYDSNGDEELSFKAGIAPRSVLRYTDE